MIKWKKYSPEFAKQLYIEYQTGKSATQLAQKYELHNFTITTILKQYGYPLRTLSDAQILSASTRDQIAWNKGLTKETNEGLRIASQKRIGSKRSEESKRKMSLARMGVEPWNKNKKFEQITGENHHMWKGDKVGYDALHSWVERKLGKANACWICETKIAKRYHCANISGKYMRDLDDWLSLCVSCHKRCDAKNGWLIPFRKEVSI